MYDEDTMQRLDQLETLIRGLFNAVCSLAHELTGKELQVLLPADDESPARRWAATDRSTAWLDGEGQRFSVDLATMPAMRRKPQIEPQSIPERA